MSGTKDDDSRGDVGDALASHRSSAAEVLPTGDASAIKRLYVELGDRLESAAAGDASSVPVLSYAENAPVVASLAADITGRVLDAGCGPNPALSILLGSDPHRTMVALDIGLGTVRLARQGAAEAGVRVLAVVGDAEALPFRDGSFDGCVSEDTIEHLPNDGAAVDELARVLHAGGRAIIATPNRDRLETVRDKIRDRVRGTRKSDEEYFVSNSHLREYSWSELEELVTARFHIVRRASVGWSGDSRARFANRLVQRWPFRVFSRMVVLDLRVR